MDMAEIKDPENTLIMETTKGKVVISLLPDLAPDHVARIKELARENAYDGVVFHRVIPDFMAQTGDVKFGKKGGESFNPSRAGMGGSDKPDLKAEFSAVPHVRGTCSMARSQSPNSANSQFFVCFTDAPWLNKQYTVWGQVIEGMDFIDQIKKGEPVQDPDSIVSVRVAADVAA
jgi:peptidyl-prolyl cis-trans isomerase B (cyclophilin B)